MGCNVLRKVICIDHGLAFTERCLPEADTIVTFCFQVCLHMFSLDFLNQVANGLEKDSM
jgi:hypothetical protein